MLKELRTAVLPNIKNIVPRNKNIIPEISLVMCVFIPKMDMLLLKIFFLSNLDLSKNILRRVN